MYVYQNSVTGQVVIVTSPIKREFYILLQKVDIVKIDLENIICNAYVMTLIDEKTYPSQYIIE